MAFEGYTQETLDFLWGIRFNNERSWFLAHKQDYEAHLLAPTRALGEQVYEALHAAFPKEPFLLKLSRIYRDARRLHGNGPYKDHLWFCVRTGGEDWTGRPTFYFGQGHIDIAAHCAEGGADGGVPQGRRRASRGAGKAGQKVQ